MDHEGNWNHRYANADDDPISEERFGYDMKSDEGSNCVRQGDESESAKICSVETSEMDLYLCISMTNNVESCKQINGRVQTFRFGGFTMGRQELCAENAQKHQN